MISAKNGENETINNFKTTKILSVSDLPPFTVPLSNEKPLQTVPHQSLHLVSFISLIILINYKAYSSVLQQLRTRLHDDDSVSWSKRK
jgi:hypothetical protein